MEIERKIFTLLVQNLFKGKVIILYGARRTGKTTLVKKLLENYPQESAYINCELQEFKDVLNTTNSVLLKDFIGQNKLVVFDEAQNIENIGIVLKVLVDTFPNVQFLATGSSSFELSSRISEPLTGRSRQFLLLPFSLEEIHQTEDLIRIKASLSQNLRYGLYPQVFLADGNEKIEELMEISSNYLYKDLLQFEDIKKPELLQKLLKAVALQTGSESSLNELAQITGTNVNTIKRYLDLLEKSFVLFRLTSFSRNLRKEINKSQKIYFYDVGIRNAVIRNFNAVELRTDTGGLWENFCISERIKFNENHRRFVNSYFWRTYDQQEIDYLEEVDGKFHCFEFKFNSSSKHKIPKIFLETYPDTKFSIITPENFYTLFMEE
ncbi:ATP-binding protein [Aquiflexum sp. LQ15W]|uniref:ATP-binding protein n=1 Tax=Cognataquiflexum nitidum TaxID=2922272 RepID=UPI001F140D43|nr:ATP-binding protein [Cognataquiflexum nitidum]MCH6199796.1 ATP-binding protein [Cognataquiflexum nitidum]